MQVVNTFIILNILPTLILLYFCINNNPNISSPPPLPFDNKVMPAPIPQRTPPAIHAVIFSGKKLFLVLAQCSIIHYNILHKK